MSTVIVVDSGANHTRARLWDREQVVATAVEPVGSRHTAMDGHNEKLKAAVQQVIASVIAQTGLTPEAVVCAGMITANVGLLEVPHVAAPAGPEDLARRIVRHDFPELSSLPFYFIPGIKSVPTELNAQTLGETDILRGEEAEAAGMRELLGLTGPVLLMHYRTHHKAIAVNAEGQILYSRTSITGEVLQAVVDNTVIRSSVLGLDQVEPDESMWRAGFEQARATSFGRALFLTRVAEQIWKRSKAEATGFLLGVLMSLDLPLLEGARESGATVLVYGQGHFPKMLKTYLDGEGWPDVRLLDEATTQSASAVGAVRIYERMAG